MLLLIVANPVWHGKMYVLPPRRVGAGYRLGLLRALVCKVFIANMKVQWLPLCVEGRA